MRFKILFVLVLTAPLSIFSQKDSTFQNPALLVPYNDHGKWGWSDTLGNVVIKPEFDQTSFFSSWGENGIYTAIVGSNGHENRYTFGKGLLLPKNYFKCLSVTLPQHK